MKQMPNNSLLYTRLHKPKAKKGLKGLTLAQYSVGLRLKRATYITYKQLEASRKVISRMVKPKSIVNRKHKKLIQSSRKKAKKKRAVKGRKRFLLFRSTICVPLTKKPLQVRMGRGKGSVERYVSNSGRSRIILEMSRQRFTLRKSFKLLKTCALKLPSKVRFIYAKRFLRKEARVKIILPLIKNNNS